MVDFTHLITKFTNINDKILPKVQETHKKKLYNLIYLLAILLSLKSPVASPVFGMALV